MKKLIEFVKDYDKKNQLQKKNSNVKPPELHLATIDQIPKSEQIFNGQEFFGKLRIVLQGSDEDLSILV